MGFVKRTTALLLLAALIVALRPGGFDAATWLRSLMSPVAAGPLTVETRADLTGAVLEAYDYTAPQNRFPPHRFEHAEKARRFYALPARSGAALPPLVILLHGSGRDGRSMLDMWDGMAARGAFLLAPDALWPQWNPDVDGPVFLGALLDQAAAIQPFDRARVYLYGHSSGANMALYLANCTDFKVRAVAVHAGVLPVCERVGPPRPHLIQIGDADVSFPLKVVEKTAQQIASLGSPVTLQIIPGHDHWYYAIGPALADEAWSFLNR